MTFPLKLELPDATDSAYALVMVAFVPAVGGPAMYIVEALEKTTPVFAAASVGIPIPCTAALATVAVVAALLSVYVLASALKPKLPVMVDALALPVAAPVTV